MYTHGMYRHGVRSWLEGMHKMDPSQVQRLMYQFQEFIRRCYDNGLTTKEAAIHTFNRFNGLVLAS
jgi:hypothetical protein